MENRKTSECSIMEEVHEMRRKISAEFGHDLVFLKSTRKPLFINGFSIRGCENAKKC